MPRRVPTSVEPVPFLCPAINRTARLFREVTEPGEPRRLEALRLLREIQNGIHQLRHNDSERAKEVETLRREVERLRRSLE